MTKYEPWRSLLETLDTPVIVITFEQLDETVPLPKAAHMDPQWWSNGRPGERTVQAEAWHQAGFDVQADLQSKVATFRKIEHK